MSEKRKQRRHAKRLKVRFGENDFSSTGITSDVSATGMFIQTTKVPAIGNRIHVELTLPSGRLLFCEAAVMRQQHVPPELRQAVKGGVGVRFLSPGELVAEMVPHLKDSKRLCIDYQSHADFKVAWDREIKRGGIFVWTEAHPVINSIVSIEFNLEFATRRLAFDARVVHLMNDANRRGMAVMFLDPAGAAQAFAAIVEP